MATVVLLGTLDTKGHEYAYLRERLREHGVEVLLVDAGVNEPLVEPDLAVGRPAYGDRGAAVEEAGRGAEELVLRLHEEGRLDGILALGGSGGTAIATQAMRALPVGVPKLMVSTMASGDTRPYVGAVDVTMAYSVVDIAGINAVSARILANAAAAMAGMVTAEPPAGGEREAADRRLDVRRHDPVRDRGARAAGGARLRGARLSRDRDGRAVDGGADARRLHHGRARRHDDRAGGRPRGRRAVRGPRPARGGRRARPAAGRVARGARHGQLRPARLRAGAIPRPAVLRAQPDGHADADDAGRVRGARPAHRAQAECGDAGR